MSTGVSKLPRQTSLKAAMSLTLCIASKTMTKWPIHTESAKSRFLLIEGKGKEKSIGKIDVKQNTSSLRSEEEDEIFQP